ncbi:class I SAM-dependent methyltransferase [Cumulibacter manganitolerans]|uniref:class I SAM-dependent methyltransferase n=1 Tax=Cumulibacter manganitolerans TaxID=1884992 RepID=UPI0012958382|nr:class I SAM-dependent methyltransferase [Cumulibacter manganitolerans]
MSADDVFAGSIPQLYDSVLVPMVFLDYAEEVARAASAGEPRDVLETAAGTGVLTRTIHRVLPQARITATDLNPAMLARAAERLPESDRVRWRPANAQSLPFDDRSFDAVLCQFGAMFFPDRPGAYAEVRRVLRPGGRFVTATWGALEDNEVALVVEDALRELYPDDPPVFFRRVPFGYTDAGLIRHELEGAGLRDVEVREVRYRNAPASAREIALAHCQGTPMANVLAERGLSLPQVTDAVTALLEQRLGTAPYEGRILANIATATA